jgi:hypothetical protein
MCGAKIVIGTGIERLRCVDPTIWRKGHSPKKEKKEEAEEPTDEPSGSSKAQKANDEVSLTHAKIVIGTGIERLRCVDPTIWRKGHKTPLPS